MYATLDSSASSPALAHHLPRYHQPSSPSLAASNAAHRGSPYAPVMVTVSSPLHQSSHHPASSPPPAYEPMYVQSNDNVAQAPLDLHQQTASEAAEPQQPQLKAEAYDQDAYNGSQPPAHPLPPSPSSDSRSDSPRTPSHAQQPQQQQLPPHPYSLSQLMTMDPHISSGSNQGLSQVSGTNNNNNGELTPPLSASHSKELVANAVGQPQAGDLSDYHQRGSQDYGRHLNLPQQPSAPFPPASAYDGIRFNREQIDCICDSLQQRNEVKRLEAFLRGGNHRQPCGGHEESEAVTRARAFTAFESANYRELYQILESRDFEPKHHLQLQEMWYRAHYREAEAVRGRQLGESAFPALASGILFLFQPSPSLP